MPLVQDYHEQAAPFTAVRWKKDAPPVPVTLSDVLADDANR